MELPIASCTAPSEAVVVRLPAQQPSVMADGNLNMRRPMIVPSMSGTEVAITPIRKSIMPTSFRPEMNDGPDATGLPFNSIFAILLENDHPSTPLVNAGAISACSMIDPKGNSDAKWKAITDNITDLCGSAPVLIDELYRSESATNFNNRAITWLLKNYNRIYDDPDMSLDLYTRQCSLGITSEQLAVMAATIASGGVNPVTRKSVFDAAIAPKITTLIATVGFYQHSGDWLYTSGVPAKSGVGGGVLGVIPGVLGIAAFAPPLDEAGNSVKAQAAVKEFAQILRLGVMNGDRVTISDLEIV